MQKTLTTAVLVVGLSVGAGSASFGQPAQLQTAPAGHVDETTMHCQNLFAANKPSIERLAQAGNKKGIRSLYIKAGCMAPGISIGNPPAGRAIPHVVCTGTLWPVNITCTFSLATKQVASAVD